jgi:hypothetical protein
MTNTVATIIHAVSPLLTEGATVAAASSADTTQENPSKSKSQTMPNKPEYLFFISFPLKRFFASFSGAYPNNLF